MDVRGPLATRTDRKCKEPEGNGATAARRHKTSEDARAPLAIGTDRKCKENNRKTKGNEATPARRQKTSDDFRSWASGHRDAKDV